MSRVVCRIGLRPRPARRGRGALGGDDGYRACSGQHEHPTRGDHEGASFPCLLKNGHLPRTVTSLPPCQNYELLAKVVTFLRIIIKM
jgi:hypothetical protein